MANSRTKDKLIQNVMYGYFQKTIELDQKENQQWLQDKYLTSHFRAYTCIVEEQEIATRYLINKKNSMKEKHQPSVINVDFAKQISKTSLISSVSTL